MPSSWSQSALPRVSVIVVNWNRLRELRRTLDYLARQRYPDFETIVIDNGSTDGSREHLRCRDDFHLVELGENRGPASARNAGAQVASGAYLFFLDSDAHPTKTAFGKLVRRMEADPSIGVIGGRVTNFETRGVDQWVYAQPYRTHGAREFETYSFSAAGAMARAEAFHAAGGFWAELFIYNEEVELSIRLFRGGYRALYSPEARVFHRASSNARVGTGTYYYCQSRNWIRIFYRHYPGFARWRRIATYVGVYLTKGVVRGRLRGCLRGIWDGLRDRSVVRRYPDKLSRGQLRALHALNKRTRIKFREDPGARR